MNEIVNRSSRLVDLYTKFILVFPTFLILDFLFADFISEVSDGCVGVVDSACPIVDISGETFGFFLLALTFAVIVFFGLFSGNIGSVLIDEGFFLGN
jgi:hypothetical protein